MANSPVNLSLLRVSFMAAIRRVRKNLTISLLNVICLSFGIAGFLLITLYVINEYNFNKNYNKFGQLARITTTFRSIETGQTDNLAYSMPALIDLLKEHPQIEGILGLILPENDVPVEINEKVFYEGNFLRTQSSYFGFFDHQIISGDSSTALDDANSIVLTRSLAIKYFGLEPALGKSLRVEDEEYVVKAVIEDLPTNVDLRFDALLSLSSQQIESFSDWAYIFLLTSKNANQAELQEFVDEIYKSNFQEAMLESQLDGQFTIEMLSDMHFGPEYQGDPVKGNKFQLLALESIGIVILIVSMINYINFTISQSAKRNAEIGIRKVFGATSKGIILQCATESLVFVSLGVCLAIGIYYLFSQELQVIVGYKLSLRDVNSTYFILVIVVVLPLITILAGVYQAVFFSNINPIFAIRSKNAPGQSRKLVSLPNALLFFQLCASITLILSSLIISRQIKLLTTVIPSFNKDQVMIISVPQDVDEQPLIDFKNTVSQFASTVSVSQIGKNSLPTTSLKHFDVYSVSSGNGEKTKISSSINVDREYIDLLQIKTSLGRGFTERDFSSDSTLNILVNETFVKSFDLANPIDKIVKYGQVEYRIVGVVKDFNDNGLQKRVESIILFPLRSHPEMLLVKISEVNEDFVQRISEVWRATVTQVPIEYTFLDKEFLKQFKRESMLQKLTSYFSSLAIIIAFAGLFSITMLDFRRKITQFTVRKIFGASMWDITWAAGKIYVIVFAVAIAISVPILILWMSDWLSNFRYRTGFGIYMIIPVALLGIGVLSIVMLQVFLVTRKNSLEGLRTQ